MSRIYLLFFMLMCMSACTNKDDSYQIPLQAHLSGSWYPAKKEVLAQTIQELDVNAEDLFAMHADASKIRALIVPHAGYIYSGMVAAAAYRLVKNSSVDRVIIIGPAHSVPMLGAALPAADYAHIPSGRLLFDTGALALLKKHALYQNNAMVFNAEHSVEMQFPLIHYFLPKAKVVPIIVGDMSSEDIEAMITSLQPIITATTLVVISSDFTHHGQTFGYMPFEDAIVLRVRQLDSSILGAIQQQDYRLFKSILKKTGDTVCGRMPIAILLKMIEKSLFGEVKTRLVAYGTSEQVSGDSEHLVTYASLMVTQETDNKTFNGQEQQALLVYARTILQESFKKTVDPILLRPVITPALEQTNGVFVTLYTKNSDGSRALRGCIGSVSRSSALYETVAAMTHAAAFKDSRFEPVTESELPNIQISISMLTKPYPVSSYKDIVLNKHGIILSQGNAQALFLPKVAEENSFNLEQTLTELSKKAGLPADAWKQPETQFQVFDSVDFEEK